MASSYLPAHDFAKALEAAGVISDLNSITRIVIDVDPSDVVKVYVERTAAAPLKEVTGLLGQMMQDGRAVAPVTHACPPGGAQRTPCCQQVPFDLPRTDRITADHSLVTCKGGA